MLTQGWHPKVGAVFNVSAVAAAAGLGYSLYILLASSKARKIYDLIILWIFCIYLHKYRGQKSCINLQPPVALQLFYSDCTECEPVQTEFKVF